MDENNCRLKMLPAELHTMNHKRFILSIKIGTNIQTGSIRRGLSRRVERFFPITKKHSHGYTEGLQKIDGRKQLIRL